MSKEETKTAEEYCTDWVINYCENNWDNIDLVRCELSSKELFIKHCKHDFSLVTWFITEVLTWGLWNNEEINNYKVNESPLVYKLGDKEIKFTLHVGYTWKVKYARKVLKTIYVYE